MMVRQPAIRLIVADLDGTLLNSAHALSPATDRAVRRAQARGVLFTVATGKTFASTREPVERYDIGIPLICSNGTQVFWPDGSLLHEDPIPQATALEAVCEAQARGFIAVIYTRSGLLSEVHDANIAELVAHHEPVPELVPSIVDALENGHRAYKLVLMSQDHAAIAALQGFMSERLAGRAETVRSGLESLFEVMPCGVTKGTALKVILDTLDIPVEQAMALGDNCNDLAMIRLAGVGVAMGHAPDAVKAGADYVTATNDEDGAAAAIERFVLARHEVEEGAS